jgi:hypothetical protein
MLPVVDKNDEKTRKSTICRIARLISENAVPLGMQASGLVESNEAWVIDRRELPCDTNEFILALHPLVRFIPFSSIFTTGSMLI